MGQHDEKAMDQIKRSPRVTLESNVVEIARSAYEEAPARMVQDSADSVSGGKRFSANRLKAPNLARSVVREMPSNSLA